MKRFLVLLLVFACFAWGCAPQVVIRSPEQSYQPSTFLLPDIRIVILNYTNSWLRISSDDPYIPGFSIEPRGKRVVEIFYCYSNYRFFLIAEDSTGRKYRKSFYCNGSYYPRIEIFEIYNHNLR